MTHAWRSTPPPHVHGHAHVHVTTYRLTRVLRDGRSAWTYDQMVAVCFSMHYVTEASNTVPVCDFNPLMLWCPTSKGFRQYGIDSHVIAINHIMGKCDVRNALASLCPKRKRGGFTKGVRPALVREARADSSDSDEDEPLSHRLLKK